MVLDVLVTLLPVFFLGVMIFMTTGIWVIGLRNASLRVENDDLKDALEKLGEARDNAVARANDFELRFAKTPLNGICALNDVDIRLAKLMNYSEWCVFQPLNELVRTKGQGHRLFVQVGLSAILEVAPVSASQKKCRAAFEAFAAKRADFVVVDRSGYAVAVIEYQGHGHRQGASIHSDAIKRELCRKAGIAFVEIPASGLDDHTRGLLLGCMKSGLVAAE
jgi:hypothetical protein